MSRLTLLVALALQLLGSMAPANAFIICVSDDGCVELEPSVPGSTRCAEDDCDNEHADASHDCRDIPVLLDAAGLKGIPTVDGNVPPVALGPAGERLVHDATALVPIRLAFIPRLPAPRRTVVLQL